MPLAAGTRLGPYEIQSLIGAGGMGEVYKARDTRLDRMVAIKVLPPPLAPDPERRRRFEQEARAVAALSHPHICVLHDIGSQAPATDSQPAVDFLVMEYLEGETLAARLGRTDASAHQGERAPLSVADALDIGGQIAGALGAAHRRGIIHRDVKPANVMLTPNGVKLLDFGLAKLRDNRDEQGRGASALTTLVTLTAAHPIVGTVPYMAPEQLTGNAVDPRTDVFALGCVLYEMLTGRRAFQGESTPSVMAAILTAQPAPPASLLPDMPPVLEQLVMTCLAKDPDRRWQNAHDVAKQLRAIARAGEPGASAVAGAPRTVGARRRPMLIGAAAITVVAVAVVGTLWWARRPPPKTHVQAASARSAEPRLDPKRVVVALFENRTGDPALDTLALETTDTLTRRLSQNRETTVADNPVVAAGGRAAPKGASAPSAEPLQALARETGAGLVVAGAISRDGDNLRFEARVIDAQGNRQKRFNPVVTRRTRGAEGLEKLGAQALTLVAVMADAPEAGFADAVDTHVPPYDAYKEAKIAAESWGADYDAFVRHADRSLAIDRSDPFGMRIGVVNAYMNRNMWTEAEKRLHELESQPGNLTASTRQLVRAIRASLAGNWNEALVANQERDRLARDWAADSDVALGALAANRPTLAAQTIEHISPIPTTLTVMKAWSRLWLATAYHLMGRYDEELRVARESGPQFPTLIAFRAHEARALIGLGKLADAELAVEGSLSVGQAAGPPVGSEFNFNERLDPGQLMCFVSMELGAHNHRTDALAMARRAVGWFEARPERERQTAPYRWLLAAAKYLAEDWNGSRLLYEPLANLQHPPRASGWSDEAAFVLAVRFRGRLGIIAARTGDRARAERIEKELARLDRRFLFGEHVYARAAIAAQLGDKAKAVGLLREAVYEGFGYVLDQCGYAEALHRSPDIAPLRGYPPFEDLMKPKG